jgi:DNA-binding winged helix-turn-helix (wHTH) protein
MIVSASSAISGSISSRTPRLRSRDLVAPDLRVVRPAGEPLAKLESIAAASTPPAQSGSIAFGDFLILQAERVLLKSGSPVSIGARAFDVLVILAERPGEVVTRKEIEARAYAGLTVSEGALRFQIAALRKVLGEGRDGLRFIANVSGRGYCFAAPVVRSEENAAPAGSNDNLPTKPQRRADAAAMPTIRAIIESRSDIAGVVSAIGPLAQSDEPIMVTFSLLGRRATLVLGDLPSTWLPTVAMNYGDAAP